MAEAPLRRAGNRGGRPMGLLTLTHSGLSARDGRGAGVRAGWHAVLEGLADCLDGQATPWALKEQREGAVAPLYPPLPS